jgi:ubiquinone/menaquinone biosynthesis C-methylase UbiE
MNAPVDLKPTQRFSSRVDTYIKFRPSYPPELFEFMDTELGLRSGKRVADVGSGTGIFSRQLVDRGIEVFGIEPNREMRLAGEAVLKEHPLFHSMDTTAEYTALPTQYVDFVTAAQSFHWFDREKSKTEFHRILKPSGLVLLIWNERVEVGTAFAEDYEKAISQHCEDYTLVKRQNMAAMSVFDKFYEPGFKRKVFTNSQQFDFEGLKGRLLSSSYAPMRGHPSHEPCMKALKKVFDKHQRDEKVCMDYETAIYYGVV